MSLSDQISTLGKFLEGLFHDDVPLAFEVATDEPPPFVAAGAIVRLVNGKLGVVEFCGLSPYWPEERDGVQRAYVVSLHGAPAWSEYALVSEIEAVLA